MTVGAAGSEGEAGGDFAGTCCRAGEEKAGDVDAADREDQADGSPHEADFRTKLEGASSLHGYDFFFERDVCRQVHFVKDGTHDGVQLGVGLGEGDSGLEAGDDFVIRSAALAGRGGLERSPEIGGGIGSKIARHNADDRKGRATQVNGAADDGWIALKQALPDAEAEDS